MSYAADVAAAIRLVGETVTIRRVTGGIFDPDTGGVTGETAKDYSAPGAFSTYDDGLIDGSSVRGGDLKVEMLTPTANDDTTIVPQAGDNLLRGTDELEVLAVRRRTIEGVDLSYQLQVRGRG